MGSSTLACIGLEVTEPGELIRLLQDASCTARPAGTFNGVSVMRWQDPSGAALVIGARDGQVEDLVATYASTAGGCSPTAAWSATAWRRRRSWTMTASS